MACRPKVNFQSQCGQRGTILTIELNAISKVGREVVGIGPVIGVELCTTEDMDVDGVPVLEISGDKERYTAIHCRST